MLANANLSLVHIYTVNFEVTFGRWIIQSLKHSLLTSHCRIDMKRAVCLSAYKYRPFKINFWWLWQPHFVKSSRRMTLQTFAAGKIKSNVFLRIMKSSDVKEVCNWQNSTLLEFYLLEIYFSFMNYAWLKVIDYLEINKLRCNGLFAVV